MNSGFVCQEIKVWAFCCIPNSCVFNNMHFCTFILNLFKTNYCFVVHKNQPFRIVSIFKSLLEKKCILNIILK